MEHTKIQVTSKITVDLIQSVGGDHMVVAAAKVSTSGAAALELQNAPVEDNAGLINYLMKHRHGTPFEHSSLTFFVHAPIFVWREWHRHRHMSFNEESARYKKLDPVFYLPEPDRPMIPVEGFKSARPGFDTAGKDQYHELCQELISTYSRSYETYERLLGEDENRPRFDRGLARACLPVAIYSSCWVTCNPRSLMHFLSLRTHREDATYVSYPLWEIELAANVCEDLFAEGWPLTYAAFVKNGRVAP